MIPIISNSICRSKGPSYQLVYSMTNFTSWESIQGNPEKTATYCAVNASSSNNDDRARYYRGTAYHPSNVNASYKYILDITSVSNNSSYPGCFYIGDDANFGSVVISDHALYLRSQDQTGGGTSLQGYKYKLVSGVTIPWENDVIIQVDIFGYGQATALNDVYLNGIKVASLTTTHSAITIPTTGYYGIEGYQSSGNSTIVKAKQISVYNII